MEVHFLTPPAMVDELSIQSVHERPIHELPEGYYLDNFHFLLSFVTNQYSHLLHDDELAYTQQFQHLQPESQMLYVRLIQRRGPLFRSDKLAYEEIPEIELAIEELRREGFLDNGEDADKLDKLGLLTKKELLELPGAHELDRSARKFFILEELVEAGVEISGYEIVRPLLGEVLQLYKLLFFGNLNQDFTEFVLNDLGVTPFEDYEIDIRSSFYQNRMVVDQVLELYELNEESYLVIEEGDKDSISKFVEKLPERPLEPRLVRRHDRILNRLARQYERLGALDEALLLYRQSQLPPTRERQARVLQKQGQAELCTEQCLRIIRDPIHDEEYEFATRFLSRHLKKHPDINGNGRSATVLDASLLNFEPVVRTVSTVGDPDKRVEEIACDWFRAQDQEAFYVENSLLPGLFGLAFWDIIFLSVNGAFFNPFQRGPADMFSPEFYRARQEQIEKRMLQLHNQEYLKKIILDQYHAKFPRANYFVHWPWLTLELLDRFLNLIPAVTLVTVFQRLIKDPVNNRSGFPDLIVFDGNQYSFVEIKGPGDRLQNNQLRWLRHFDSVGIPAEVVHVTYEPAADNG